MNIVEEVTGNPNFSMFNLSLKEDWESTNRFCYHFTDKKVNGFNHEGNKPVTAKGE